MSLTLVPVVGLVHPPRNVMATVTPDRVIELRWEGTLRNGTLYSIQRALPSCPHLATVIGIVADTRFKDVMLPAGVSGATYTVQAHCDDIASDPGEPVTVSLDVASTLRKAA